MYDPNLYNDYPDLKNKLGLMGVFGRVTTLRYCKLKLCFIMVSLMLIVPANPQYHRIIHDYTYLKHIQSFQCIA